MSASLHLIPIGRVVAPSSRLQRLRIRRECYQLNNVKGHHNPFLEPLNVDAILGAIRENSQVLGSDRLKDVLQSTVSNGCLSRSRLSDFVVANNVGYKNRDLDQFVDEREAYEPNELDDC